MGKRRISSAKMREIAETRMGILFDLAVREASSGGRERSRRYVHIARRIGMRTRTQVPKNIRYCKSCLSPMVPGANCRVRLRNGRVCIHCLDCDNIKRMPYLKEKRVNDREECDEGTA